MGRLASQIAKLVRGKHKPTYTPNVDCGDHVVVVNAKHVTLTGKKWEQKLYRKHTGFAGGLKEIKAADLRDTYPERVILRAVRGMIPKTMHKLPQLSRLRVYADHQHPFADIFPNVQRVLDVEELAKIKSDDTVVVNGVTTNFPVKEDGTIDTWNPVGVPEDRLDVFYGGYEGRALRMNQMFEAQSKLAKQKSQTKKV